MYIYICIYIFIYIDYSNDMFVMCLYSLGVIKVFLVLATDVNTVKDRLYLFLGLWVV